MMPKDREAGGPAPLAGRGPDCPLCLEATSVRGTPSLMIPTILPMGFGSMVQDMSAHGGTEVSRTSSGARNLSNLSGATHGSAGDLSSISVGKRTGSFHQSVVSGGRSSGQRGSGSEATAASEAGGPRRPHSGNPSTSMRMLEATRNASAVMQAASTSVESADGSGGAASASEASAFARALASVALQSLSPSSARRRSTQFIGSAVFRSSEPPQPDCPLDMVRRASSVTYSKPEGGERPPIFKKTSSLPRSGSQDGAVVAASAFSATAEGSLTALRGIVSAPIGGARAPVVASHPTIREEDEERGSRGMGSALPLTERTSPRRPMSRSGSDHNVR